MALPSGDNARGVARVRAVSEDQPDDDFIKTFCEKFLGYALGRSLEVSDYELLEQMQRNLRQNEYRFATLFETVVCSSQFRKQRCRDFTLARFKSESQGE